MSEQKEMPTLRKNGAFMLRLVPYELWLAADKSATFPAHEGVLRPLLSWATECWAYGVGAGTDVYRAAYQILRPENRRNRVLVDGDPIRGREFFWNASGGARGTIVILVPKSRFDPRLIFPHCEYARVADNPQAGHTPAAMQFVKASIASGELIACCLPRNNGFEWMDVFATPSNVEELWAARTLCRAH